MSITLLMLTSLFAALPTTSEALTINSNTTWTGNVTVDENILVAAGRTLTIDEGANITVTGDYLITVDGTIQISGSESKPVVVTNNNNPIGAGSNTGWWDGFRVNTGGSIDASWATFSRGRRMIESFGQVTLDDVTIENSHFGVETSSLTSLDGFHCSNIDFTCLSILPSSVVTADTMTVTSTSYGVENGGTLTLDGFQMSQGGTALSIYDGSAGSIQNAAIDNVTVAVMSRDITSVSMNSIQVDDSGLFFDSIGTDGLVISDVNGTGNDRLVVGTNMQNVVFDQISLSGSGSSGWMIAAENSGTFEIRDSAFSGFDDGFRLTGSGTHEVIASSLSVSGSVFDISGDGRFESNGSNYTTSSDFGQISGTDSLWMNSNINGGTSSNGIELIDGKHIFESSTVSRSYLYADSTSSGLGVTWGDIEAHGLTLSGWSDGIECRTDCLVAGSSLTVNGGGVQTGSGINVDGGSLELESLTTGSAFHGVNLVAGDVHIEDWSAAGHQDATLQVGIGQTAVVRNLPAFSSNGLWDADGEGTLLFGGSSARVDTGIYDEFSESTISVTDLSSLPISGVTVSAHGFDEQTDVSGEAALPLLQSGSDVFADDGTYGVSDNFSPPGGTLQLPVIPSSGSWTIPTGVHAVLIGGVYIAPSGGNVTISTAASLTLKNALLEVPNGDIIVEGSGQLIGENGSTDAVVRTTGAFAIQGIGAGLTVANDVHHGCSLEEHVWSGLHVEGDFYLEQTCRLNIFDGNVDGTIHPSMGGYFSLSNAAEIRVVDFGEPVEGATVTVQGEQATTNSEGIAVFRATYRNVTEVSDSSTGILQVYVSNSGHTSIKSWDPTSSASFDIMMSTVNGGYLAEWLVLDATFSPYFLDENLTIVSGTTLTIQPFASLTVKGDRGISIEGVLELNSASLGGSNWNGLSLTNGGVASLSNGQLMGGVVNVPSTSSLLLDNMIVSNNPILISGDGSVVISDSMLYQSDNCIFANGGSLEISGSSISDCSQSAMLLTQSDVDISDITLGTGNEKGIHLRGTTGQMNGVLAENHSGNGPTIHLEMVDENLEVTNLNVSSGVGAPAVAVEWSEMMKLTNSEIYGEPGMIVEHSTIYLTTVDFYGDGSGTALHMTGARADSSIIKDCDFDDYGTSVHLEGDEGDLQMAQTIFDSNHHHSSTAFASNNINFVSTNEVIEGSIDFTGSKDAYGAIWNAQSFESSQVSVSGLATIFAGATWQLRAIGDAGSIVTTATITVTVPDFNEFVGEQYLTTDTTSGSGDFDIIYQAWSEAGSTTSPSAMWGASAPSYIESEGSFIPSEYSSREVDVQLTLNQPPTVSIVLPFPNTELQEGQSVNISATGNDPDSGLGEELTYQWFLRPQGENPPGNAVLTGRSGQLGSIGEVGVYILTVRATDNWGGIAEDSMTFTVILDDADEDFIDTCPSTGSNAWYDLEEDRPCGPDVYDDDDDNDRIPDSRDLFPFDPCAHSDNDLDGLPNSILPNCETDLIADDDDDNDGTLDSADPDPMDATISGKDSENSEGGLLSPSVIIPVVLIVVVVIAIFLRGSRDEFGGQEGA